VQVGIILKNLVFAAVTLVAFLIWFGLYFVRAEA